MVDRHKQINQILKNNVSAMLSGQEMSRITTHRLAVIWNERSGDYQNRLFIALADSLNTEELNEGEVH